MKDDEFIMDDNTIKLRKIEKEISINEKF